MKATLLVAALFCIALPASAQTCREKHPSWSAKDCERVAKKEIWIGMSGEMLLASQGAPAQSRKRTTAQGVVQVWVYQKEVGSAYSSGYCVSGCHIEQMLVTVTNSRVTAIEN